MSEAAAAAAPQINKVTTAWYNQEEKQVHLPKGRLLYPSLLKPSRMKGQDNAEPKFSTSIVLPPGVNLDALKKEAARVARDKFGAKMPKGFRSPFLQTSDYDKLASIAETYPVMIRASARLEWPPYIFAPNAQLFKGPESEIYSGRWAYICVAPFAYDAAGNRGVSFGLRRVHLVDHDEPLAGARVPTASGFAAVEVAGMGGTASAMFDDKDADDKPADARRSPVDMDDEIPF